MTYLNNTSAVGINAQKEMKEARVFVPAIRVTHWENRVNHGLKDPVLVPPNSGNVFESSFYRSVDDQLKPYAENYVLQTLAFNNPGKAEPKALAFYNDNRVASTGNGFFYLIPNGHFQWGAYEWMGVDANDEPILGELINDTVTVDSVFVRYHEPMTYFVAHD